MPTPLDNGRRSPKKLLRAVVARLLGKARVRPPTDYELLNAIYKRHRAGYERYQADVPARAKRIMVPIDIPAIAQQLGVNANSVFGRLYYHLEPAYGDPVIPGKLGRKAFFPPQQATLRTV